MIYTIRDEIKKALPEDLSLQFVLLIDNRIPNVRKPLYDWQEININSLLIGFL